MSVVEETTVVENEIPLVGDLMRLTRLSAEDEGYAATRAGVELLLTELIANKRTDERVDKRFVDG